MKPSGGVPEMAVWSDSSQHNAGGSEPAQMWSVWGREDGATLLSKGRDILLLNEADPAPGLSSPQSHSETVTNQIPGLLDRRLPGEPRGPGRDQALGQASPALDWGPWRGWGL